MKFEINEKYNEYFYRVLHDYWEKVLEDRKTDAFTLCETIGVVDETCTKMDMTTDDLLKDYDPSVNYMLLRAVMEVDFRMQKALLYDSGFESDAMNLRKPLPPSWYFVGKIEKDFGHEMMNEFWKIFNALGTWEMHRGSEEFVPNKEVCEENNLFFGRKLI